MGNQLLSAFFRERTKNSFVKSNLTKKIFFHLVSSVITWNSSSQTIPSVVEELMKVMGMAR